MDKNALMWSLDFLSVYVRLLFDSLALYMKPFSVFV